MNSDWLETCFRNVGGSPTSFGKKIFMEICFHTNSILWKLQIILWNNYGPIEIIQIPYYGNCNHNQSHNMAICMISNSHIMEFVWFQIQTNFKFFVQKSHFQVQMAGKVEVTVRILVYWALAKKNERKTMKNSIFFCFWDLFVSKN